MSRMEAKLTIRVADIDRFRLLVWEMRMLADRMRVEASPHAEALERILNRWADGGDDERADPGDD